MLRASLTLWIKEQAFVILKMPVAAIHYSGLLESMYSLIKSGYESH